MWRCLGLSHDYRRAIFDIFCENEKGGFFIVEMPKFALPLSACDTIYLKWLYVLNNIDIMEWLPEELNNQIFQKLKSIVEVERMTADERLEYELSLAAERDLLACMATQFEEGEAKGEAKEKIKIARNLKSLSLPIETIAQVTGLTLQEITNLT